MTISDSYNKIMNKDISRKKFLGLLGGGLIGLPLLSKSVLGSIFFRDNDKNSFKLLTDTDLTPYWKSDGTSTATGDYNLGNYNLIAKDIISTNSKTITYNLDGTVNIITTSEGTKTMNYNLDGSLASITGTGIYVSKTFTYTDGLLTNIEVI